MTNDHFKMIDPACGSGHFLLGAFPRILQRWQKQEPGTNVRELVQRALDSVHGVDINPFAVAIARFRLLLAAMQRCQIQRLLHAPAFQVHILCGDSLLHGSPGGDQQLMAFHDVAHAYHSEDLPELRRILTPGAYHAVVANPPYITPKDRALGQVYRRRFSTCHRQYSLAVPFMQRIFDLATSGGFTGQITANSFMKREFGKKLIEKFFETVDLTHVIDTSGAYIPGHGTPTVILLGRQRGPVGDSVRSVMGIRGEPSTPDDPAQGLVWSAIVKQIDQSGSESDFVSVGDSPRANFLKHPWSIGGGGAAELKDQIEGRKELSLGQWVEAIGRTVSTQGDDIYINPFPALRRKGVAAESARRVVSGDEVRNWRVAEGEHLVFPYDADGHAIQEHQANSGLHFLWRSRTVLANTFMFGGKTKVDVGMKWFEYGQWLPHRFRTPFSIAFAFVATHNHFVLDRGGKVFNRSAPVIKLPEEASEDDHLALLGLLNSSIGCFWMKQVFHNKGGQGINEGLKSEEWEKFFEYDGTKVKQFPLPCDRPLAITRELDQFAGLLADSAPEKLLEAGPAERSPEALATRQFYWEGIRQQMIAWQEELDWQRYGLYGLLDEDLTTVARPPSTVARPPSAVAARSPSAVANAPPKNRPLKATPFKPVYRRNLPHIIDDERPLFVTFCTHRGFVLPESVRQAVLEHCLFDDGKKLHLHGAVVMPDHVHLVLSLLRDSEGNPFGLPEIMGGIKGASAHTVNKLLKRKGHVWQDESYDHLLRDEESLDDTVLYVCQNPVRKGLVEQGEEYPFLYREGMDRVDSRGNGQDDADREDRAGNAQPGAAVLHCEGPPAIELGQRAFEIVLARKAAEGKTQTTWFKRHGSTPITEIPEHWPDDYRRLVQRRIEVIEQNKNIRLIEQPEYKRRWNTEPWESQLERALRNWLLGRLEGYFDFDGRMAEGLTQRREDAKKEKKEKKKGEELGDLAALPEIPVPPKYKSSDFISTGGAKYWKLRGKLDVPKERWVSFPHCEGEDGAAVIAWAGYDHLQLARAVSAYYVDIQERLGGRDDPRLAPLLACLVELLPWLKQWHNEVDPEFGMAMGDYFAGFISEEARQMGKTVDEVKAWEPLKKAGRGKKKTATK